MKNSNNIIDKFKLSNKVKFDKKEYAKGLQYGSDLGHFIVRNNKLAYMVNGSFYEREINDSKNVNFLLGVLDSGAKVKYFKDNDLEPITLTEGTDSVLTDKVQQTIDLLNRVMPTAKIEKLKVLDHEPLMTQIKKLAGEDVSLSDLEFDETNNVYKVQNKEEYFYLSNYDAERNILQHKLQNIYGENKNFIHVPELKLGAFSKTTEKNNVKYGEQKFLITKLDKTTEENTNYIYQNNYSHVPEIPLTIKREVKQKLK